MTKIETKMIEYIKGEIVELTPTQMIIECGCIGYELNISLNTYSFYNGKSEGKIYIYEVIREDAHLLFGFAEKIERELFLMLITVSGVGPNTARMRMYLTNFKEPVVLRFGTLQLVRGDWRTYELDLSNPKMPPAAKATLDVSTVNIEENSDRKPVNYVLPPGVTRVLDPSQPQVRQENEQSLSMKVTDLYPLDACCLYIN